MEYTSAIAFGIPILLVFVMNLTPAFDGWKTRIQASLAAIFTLIESADLSFLPSDTSSALVFGASIAAIIGVQMRAKPVVDDFTGENF